MGATSFQHLRGEEEHKKEPTVESYAVKGGEHEREWTSRWGGESGQENEIYSLTTIDIERR